MVVYVDRESMAGIWLLQVGVVLGVSKEAASAEGDPGVSLVPCTCCGPRLPIEVEPRTGSGASITEVSTLPGSVFSVATPDAEFRGGPLTKAGRGTRAMVYHEAGCEVG
jgi:hypothetical protein